MPTVSITELVDRAKAAADMRDNFVTPTQWMYWANQERLALDLFLARSGWTLAYEEHDITVTGNEGGLYEINPTQGVLALVCLYQVDSAGRIRMLKNQDAVSFLRRQPGYSGSPSGNANYYRVQHGGANPTSVLFVNMYPEPSPGETYKALYVPAPKKLVYTVSDAGTEAASFNYPMGWEERIVLGMARRALIKEESDTRAIDQEIAVWDQRIEEACWSRVLSESPAVRNTDSLNYGWTDRYSIPPVTYWTWV